MDKADYSLQNLRTLLAVSRSIVLQKTRAIGEVSRGPGFRSFRKAVEVRRGKEIEWINYEEDVFDRCIKKNRRWTRYMGGRGSWSWRHWRAVVVHLLMQRM